MAFLAKIITYKSTKPTYNITFANTKLYKYDSNRTKRCTKVNMFGVKQIFAFAQEFGKT